MAQLVSDFIITPVLRQARRFSAGFAAHEPPAIEDPALRRRRARSTVLPAATAAAILEGEEASPAAHLPFLLPETQQAPPPAASPSPSLLRAAPENFNTAGPHPPADTERNRQNITPSTNTASDAPPAAPWPLPETNKAAPLPEDDGMGDLRRRIQEIQQLDVAQDAKAQMMHGLFTEGYTRLHRSPVPAQTAMRPVSPASTSTLDIREATEHAGPLQVLKKWNPLGDGSGRLNLPLTEEDLRPTFAPNKRGPNGVEWWAIEEQEEEEETHLGCEHYRRNIKLQCASCERWYTCRHCHDAVEDHVLPRQQTKHMLCMLCGCAQKASDTCTKCAQSAAYYYCGICKLWNDDANKPIYHCSDCGLCRVGQGLGKDFFHCKKCVACISTSEANNHKCIERAVDSDCPICNEYLFNSPKSVTFMQCGHSIHLLCLEELKKTAYRCPLCNKSCVNMEYRFRQLDMEIIRQPMPPDYTDARAVISCNDCSAKSQTAFHWLGLKCAVCTSYNTTQLQLLNMPGGAAEQAPQPSSQQQPIALDPTNLADEIRRRNRAARREQERQRGQEQISNNNNNTTTSSFSLLSSSPSYSPAFLTRFLNRATTPSSEPERPSSSSSSLPATTAAAQTKPAAAACATDPNPATSNNSDDSDEEDDQNEDMLDLFGARDRDFDRMTGLTSAESAVGFDDDDEDDEEDESSGDEADEEDEDEEDEDDEEEEEDDILLLGHR